jgi:hypothetical protein
MGPGWPPAHWIYAKMISLLYLQDALTKNVFTADFVSKLRLLLQ